MNQACVIYICNQFERTEIIMKIQNNFSGHFRPQKEFLKSQKILLKIVNMACPDTYCIL